MVFAILYSFPIRFCLKMILGIFWQLDAGKRGAFDGRAETEDGKRKLQAIIGCGRKLEKEIFSNNEAV